MQTVSAEARRRMIGEAAYYRSQKRGFSPGHELDDWLAAEADLERASMRRDPPESDALEELEEFGMHGSGLHGAARDDALKKFLKQHPRREIPRIESVEPEDAPLKD